MRDCGLARLNIPHIQRQGARLPGEQRTHGRRPIGFQKQPAVCVGNFDGAVDHRAQDFLERHARLQERSSFQQQAQLAKVAGAALERRSLLQAGENFGKRFFCAAYMKN